MWARVRLRRQLTKLVDGGGQQRVLGPHRAVRLTGRVRRTVIVHGRHAALHSGQVVKMAIFCERQQFIREFGWRVLFIGLLSLVPIAILGRAVHDDEERLPWSCLIMDLWTKRRTERSPTVSLTRICRAPNSQPLVTKYNSLLQPSDTCLPPWSLPERTQDAPGPASPPPWPPSLQGRESPAFPWDPLTD